MEGNSYWPSQLFSEDYSLFRQTKVRLVASLNTRVCQAMVNVEVQIPLVNSHVSGDCPSLLPRVTSKLVDVSQYSM